MSPYKLVFGKACHLPIELEHHAYWDIKKLNFNPQKARELKVLQPNGWMSFRAKHMKMLSFTRNGW